MQPELRSGIVDGLQSFWPQTTVPLQQLPIVDRRPDALTEEVPNLIPIQLPGWAQDIAIDGALPVPRWATASDDWSQTDWWSAAAWYLHGICERNWEQRHGPIHSYAMRLRGWDAQMFDRAWVNRIALFLRRWSEHTGGSNTSEQLGPLPEPQLHLTHDIDAITKTSAIRLKQSAFKTFNALRALGRLDLTAAGRNLRSAFRFLLKPQDYNCFTEIAAIESAFGMTSTFNVYPGATRQGLRSWLFNPAYRATDPELVAALQDAVARGCAIGLHPDYDCWHDSDAYRAAKAHVEAAIGQSIERIRQHWLRFSWRDTWQAQAAAGFRIDSTLGFNDRPGFRNAAALPFEPLDPSTAQPVGLQAYPMMLMDSHLFDYNDRTDDERSLEMDYWLRELKATHGAATVIWHQRVFAPDYGWGPAYRELIERWHNL